MQNGKVVGGKLAQDDGGATASCDGGSQCLRLLQKNDDEIPRRIASGGATSNDAITSHPRPSPQNPIFYGRWGLFF